MRARVGQDRPVGVWIRHFSCVATAAALLAGVAACTDTSSEPAPAPGSGVSDSGGALTPSDSGGAGAAPSDTGGNTSMADTPSPTAAPSDGGGQRVTVTADDFPPPDPAHYPGMNTETQQGAEATVAYFWNSFYWSVWSGDTSVLEELSAEDCSSCAELISNAHEAADSYLVGTPSYVSIHGMSTQQNAQGFDWVVTVVFDEKPSWAARKGEEDRLESAVALSWLGDRWQIEAVSAQDQGTAEREESS